MAIHKTGSMMSEKDLKAAREAIRQLNERIKDSPENARRFLEKVYAPADTGDAE